jgi:hypothetical protein
LSDVEVPVIGFGVGRLVVVVVALWCGPSLGDYRFQKLRPGKGHGRSLAQVHAVGEGRGLSDAIQRRMSPSVSSLRTACFMPGEGNTSRAGGTPPPCTEFSVGPCCRERRLTGWTELWLALGRSRKPIQKPIHLYKGRISKAARRSYVPAQHDWLWSGLCLTN